MVNLTTAWEKECGISEAADLCCLVPNRPFYLGFWIGVFILWTIIMFFVGWVNASAYVGSQIQDIKELSDKAEREKKLAELIHYYEWSFIHLTRFRIYKPVED
jgi:hypothetical protein